MSRKLSISARDSADHISDVSERASLISIPASKTFARKFNNKS